MTDHEPRASGDDRSRQQDLDRELDEPMQPLQDQLRALLDPSDGLSGRTALDVDRALRARSPLTAALDLLGLGWWTAKTLLTDDPQRADGEGEGT